jgi:hypothetical protein
MLLTNTSEWFKTLLLVTLFDTRASLLALVVVIPSLVTDGSWKNRFAAIATLYTYTLLPS